MSDLALRQLEREPQEDGYALLRAGLLADGPMQGPPSPMTCVNCDQVAPYSDCAYCYLHMVVKGPRRHGPVSSWANGSPSLMIGDVAICSCCHD